jgi:outer membrane biosynthesis protein TonB
VTPRTEIPPEEAGTEYAPNGVSTPEDSTSEYEVDLLPPPSLNRAWWRTLASSLRDRIAPEKLPPLELTSHPVNLGMLPGDMLTMPWYRTIFTNLGNVITPETLPPLELESHPVDVGELIADRMGHPWWSSLWQSLRDRIHPEKLPPLRLTSQPVDPYVASEKVLRAPHWSSLIDTPKVFLPDEPQAEFARAGVPGAVPPRKPIRVDIDFTHVMVSQLKDDLARSRLREAFWMSVTAHLLIAILLVVGPKYLPGYRKGVALISAADLMRSRQVTFLELPPDLEKNIAPPKTNILSDKNRIAQSRNPVIDKKTLEQLRDMRRAGAPGAPSAPAQASPAVPAQPQQMAQAQPSPSPAGGAAPAPTNPQRSQVQLPAQQAHKGPNPFQTPLSAGAAIQQATRDAAAARGSFGGGEGGDYGLGTGQHGGIKSNLEILSDTQGVNFGPYLSRVVHVVRLNWYNLIPEVARPPLLKKGKVSIEFAIMPNGSVAGMKLAGPSGDVSLDRAAWGGITASNPFEPLPQEFHGPYLALRFNFYYNPDKNDLQ